MLIIFFFFLGAIIGSFLNVVIFRTRAQKTGMIDGRSECQSCSRELLWYDSIPLYSYFALGGKCRFCKTSLSRQYPAVELLTAIIFVLIASLLHVSFSAVSVVAVLFTCFVFASFIVIFVYDLKHMEVPMIPLWVGFVSAILVVLLGDYVSSQSTPFVVSSSMLLWHSVSAACAFFFFFSLSYVSDEQWMGYGDGYIALVIGMLLGPAATFLALFIAVMCGAFFGIALIIARSQNTRTAIPFGPFLVTGALASFVVVYTLPGWSRILLGA